MRQAVQEDRFIPLFQPKIELKTGRISGAEALARWQLENGRLVSPSVFIELAEECGLIGHIGSQIMYKACEEAARWTRDGNAINLAVNVSPRQFEDENLAEMILDALAKSGLSPRQLEVEITESLAIQQPDRVRAVLEPLRRLGMKLAMDDFGTGHSNLAVLTQIDFDVFKIDRQFLTGHPTRRASQRNCRHDSVHGELAEYDNCRRRHRDRRTSCVLDQSSLRYWPRIPLQPSSFSKCVRRNAENSTLYDKENDCLIDPNPIGGLIFSEFFVI